MNRELGTVVQKSKASQISQDNVEDLLNKLGELKTLEEEQEARLHEIEGISKIIFGKIVLTCGK